MASDDSTEGCPGRTPPRSDRETLLRQRRALRGPGANPDAAGLRPVEEVEGYLS